jgi:hypothetical protein
MGRCARRGACGSALQHGVAGSAGHGGGAWGGAARRRGRARGARGCCCAYGTARRGGGAGRGGRAAGAAAGAALGVGLRGDRGPDSHLPRMVQGARARTLLGPLAARERALHGLAYLIQTCVPVVLTKPLGLVIRARIDLVDASGAWPWLAADPAAANKPSCATGARAHRPARTSWRRGTGSTASGRRRPARSRSGR